MKTFIVHFLTEQEFDTTPRHTLFEYDLHPTQYVARITKMLTQLAQANSNEILVIRTVNETVVRVVRSVYANLIDKDQVFLHLRWNSKNFLFEHNGHTKNFLHDFPEVAQYGMTGSLLQFTK